MIVVDTNIISYLFLPTEYSETASQLYSKDPDWCAPGLWRSEFRNVLALYLRQRIFSIDQAILIMDEAEALIAEHEYSSSSLPVLNLVNTSNCSAYDCEFIALAKQLSTQLLTQDKKILREFPDIAFTMADFLRIY